MGNNSTQHHIMIRQKGKKLTFARAQKAVTMERK
jgi:hypothetical protein